MRFFFFFQAEDGIRDLTVTGVQTCALPISISFVGGGMWMPPRDALLKLREAIADDPTRFTKIATDGRLVRRFEIGRAAGRGRGEVSVVGGSFKKKKEKK